ncbi:MAG: tetratricopeptide repeat protein [Candidatus Eisenbacteria bacterium]|nr:tetratricopeptide repeat protein [Candidatus Eisenbacteria bacterium]
MLQRTWLPVLLLSCAVSFVNPYGVEGALAPLRFWEIMTQTTSATGSPIIELRSPFDPVIRQSTVAPFYLFMIVLLGIVVARMRRLNLFRIILLAALTYLALRSVRNIPLLAFSGAALAVELLACKRRGHARATSRGTDRADAEAAAARAPGRTRRALLLTAGRLTLAVVLICVATGLLTSSFYYQLGLQKQFGLGVDPRLFPQGTTERLAAAPPARIMNDQALGHYLIWRLWPETRVSLDGRSEVYDAARMRELQGGLVSADKFDRQARAAGVRSALIGHRWSYLRPLLAGLDAHPDWVMRAYDHAAVLFIREPGAGVSPPPPAALPDPLARLECTDGPSALPPARSRSFVKTWLRPTERATVENHLARARMLLATGRFEQAARESRVAVQAAPWIAEGFNHLGAALIKLGRYAEAQVALARALQIDPQHVGASRNLAALARAGAARPADARAGDVLAEDAPAEDAAPSPRDGLDAVGDPAALAERGHRAYRGGRYREAARHYVRAAEGGLGCQALIWAALAYAAGGFQEEARSHYAKAREAARSTEMRVQIDSLWSTRRR